VVELFLLNSVSFSFMIFKDFVCASEGCIDNLVVTDANASDANLPY